MIFSLITHITFFNLEIIIPKSHCVTKNTDRVKCFKNIFIVHADAVFIKISNQVYFSFKIHLIILINVWILIFSGLTSLHLYFCILLTWHMTYLHMRMMWLKRCQSMWVRLDLLLALAIHFTWSFLFTCSTNVKK